MTLMGEIGGAYKVLMGRLSGKRTLGIPGRRGEVNVKVDLQELEWKGLNWITEDRNSWQTLVNAVMNLWVQ